MLGAQVPKGFGILFVLVGIPWILWEAKGTNDELNALNSPEARYERCVGKVASMAPELSIQDREGMCRCMLLEADKRGMVPRSGSYDEQALRPVVELCYRAYVMQ